MEDLGQLASKKTTKTNGVKNNSTKTSKSKSGTTKKVTSKNLEAKKSTAKPKTEKNTQNNTNKKTTSTKKKQRSSNSTKNTKSKAVSAKTSNKSAKVYTKKVEKIETPSEIIEEKVVKNEEIKKDAKKDVANEDKNNNLNKIKGYELFIIAGSLALLIALVLMINKNNIKAHCKKAICNESGTICYNYKLDKDGNTKKTWEGSCVNK